MKKHQDAVEAAVKVIGLGELPEHGPLLELCRTLAGQMDAAGVEPSTRLTAAYLSALKDLRRASAELSPRQEGGKLAEMRAVRVRPGPTKKSNASRLQDGPAAL